MVLNLKDYIMAKKSTTLQKIQTNFYYWGPLLVKTKITDDFLKYLKLQPKNLSTKSQKMMQTLLASHIDDVRDFRDSSKEITENIIKQMTPYFNAYFQQCQQWYGFKELPERVDFDKIWMNIQKPNEINPEHIHMGDLSYVIYVDIPEQLKKENKEYTGTSTGPGAIAFSFGEKISDWNVCGQKFMPETGDMFIFPAYLRHSVMPFKSNCKRISISGNVKVTYPKNHKNLY